VGRTAGIFIDWRRPDQLAHAGLVRVLRRHPAAYAFVGLSTIRQSSRSTFGGLPVSERSTPLRCGVSVVDLAGGREVARLEFHAGIYEIFDVQTLPFRHPWFSGPHHEADEVRPIWVVPEPKGL
jgi:hypothetical protein